jgi:beta-lactamase superfamily II metal-dependent hydrolase
MIDIKIFKAENGDAFLLKFDNGQNILIDMGTPLTYESEIKDELLNLSKLDQRIDLLVVSHIDNDHIGGVIEFIKDNKKCNIIKVNEVWHNSYRHLTFTKKKLGKINQKYKAILENIKSRYTPQLRKETTSDVTFEQGSSLASLLYKYSYSWNKSFDNKAIIIENIVSINIKDIKIILLSPNQKKLDRLSSQWQSDLEDELYGFEFSDEDLFNDAFEFYMSNESSYDVLLNDCSNSTDIDLEKLAEYKGIDKSVTNGSSMAFIIEYKEKKLLFLGDAHEDIILEKLNILKNDGYELKFDLIKVSHHGSKNNISNEILNLIEVDKFLFSTNGKYHNHPDLECLSKIILSNSTKYKELIFNYKTNNSNKLDKKEFYEKYNYNIKYERGVNI